MNNSATDPDPQTEILIVDDEQDFARGLARLIGGYFPELRVSIVPGGRQALEILSQRTIRLMITDLRMPEMNGLQLATEAIRRFPGISIVVLSGYGTIEIAVQALQKGVYDFLTKPIEPEQLFRVIQKGLERSRLLDENNRLRQILNRQETREELIGEGPAIRDVRRAIGAIAQSEYTVLINGESGTGKELAARLIHRSGPRSVGPFLTVDCPSIPENLLESELFGYVKGAFTGADRNHKGLFAAADGGTLHLDEIGDISLPLQAKLLRCLQSAEVRPIGSNQPVKVNVRVVASTNRDLRGALEQKTFREDLYYRLNVLSLTMPPLRDRVEDIPLLAVHLLHCACREANLPDKELSPDVLQWLGHRSWPGNVRELQNVIRRLSVFCPGSTISTDHLAIVFDTRNHPAAGTSSLEPLAASDQTVSYKQMKTKTINDFTSVYIKNLLRSTKGNISEAARVSGLSRVALQKILNRLGEQADAYR